MAWQFPAVGAKFVRWAPHWHHEEAFNTSPTTPASLKDPFPFKTATINRARLSDRSRSIHGVERRFCKHVSKL
jgi:hypothetical protein